MATTADTIIQASQARDSGPYRITPAIDNYDREFARLEDERMWGKTWQIVCREDELKRAGDFVTFDLVRESIIVVKQADLSLKAFYNVCTHRGRKLRTEERGNTRTSFRCNYHNWRWSIDGELQYQADGSDWDNVQLCTREDFALGELTLDTWGGWVWVSMDPEIKPLHDYLAPVTAYLDPFEPEKLKTRFHKVIIFPVNWKTAQEAFNEGYHVEGTHGQILKYGSRTTISRAEGDHGWFGYAAHPVGTPLKRGEAPAIDYRQIMLDLSEEMLDWLRALNTKQTVEAARRLFDVLPATASFGEVYMKYLELLQQVMGEEGIAWPKTLTPQAISDAGTCWHIFPNTIALPDPTGILWYRSRPNGENPESCIYDVWWLERMAVGEDPEVVHEFFPTPGEFIGHNPFLEQDFENLIAVQNGMHSRGFAGQRTNPVQEVAISNFHTVLYRYLGIDG